MRNASNKWQISKEHHLRASRTPEREIENKKDFYDRTFKKENSSGFVKGTSSSLKPLMFASLEEYEGQHFPDDDIRISGII